MGTRDLDLTPGFRGRVWLGPRRGSPRPWTATPRVVASCPLLRPRCRRALELAIDEHAMACGAHGCAQGGGGITDMDWLVLASVNAHFMVSKKARRVRHS
jgi:hypothetical protein